MIDAADLVHYLIGTAWLVVLLIKTLLATRRKPDHDHDHEN